MHLSILDSEQTASLSILFEEGSEYNTSLSILKAVSDSKSVRKNRFGPSKLVSGNKSVQESRLGGFKVFSELSGKCSVWVVGLRPDSLLSDEYDI